MKEFWTLFLTWGKLKTWLQDTMKQDFGMILRFKVAQNLIANHYEQVLT